MKTQRMHNRIKTKSGSILYVVLWSLVILSVLAISMSRRTNVDIALAKHSIAKVQAKYLAWAGLIYVMGQVQQDSQDIVSRKIDNLYYCGIRWSDSTKPEDLFKTKKLNTGYFSVLTEGHYGLADEERRINLNSLSKYNYDVLRKLIILLDEDENKAREIAASILDWIDPDNEPVDESYGAENDYYEGLPQGYKCKNFPLDSIEELLLVRGISKELLSKMRPYITIYPQGSRSLKINFDTASEIVLKALARSVSGNTTNTDSSDADSLVRKMLAYRKGEDRRELTADDRMIDPKKMNLNSREKTLFNTLHNYRTQQSSYLRVVSKGTEMKQHIEVQMEAIFRREDLSIVYWQEI